MDFLTCLRLFNLNIVVFIVFSIRTSQSSVEVPRPRGVSLSRATLYDPEQDFTCFDNSKTIPYNQVNDDYCDCADGSDEPGTSACPGGKFYCSNAGHKPQILTSDRVNDGVCDCCDGTDEYSGRATCSNNCLEVGRAAREEAIRKAELLKAGKQLRADLSQEGQKMKSEKQQKLNELKKIKEEAEAAKAEREEIKKKAEEAENKALQYYREIEEQFRIRKAELEAEKSKQEAVEEFKKLDSNQDGLVDISEIQTRHSFDRDRNGEVSEEEAKVFLDNKDSVDLETFLEKSWSLAKPFLTLDANMYKPPKTDSEAEVEEEQEQTEGDQEEGGDAEHEDEDEETDEKEVEEHQDDEHVPYDEETQKLVDLATEARNLFTEFEQNLRDINNQIKEIEQSLGKDFGKEEEFAPLEGQCFEYHDHEYVYKLCPFDKTVQIPKSNQMETSLGRWGKWDSDYKDRYNQMLYENGQNCWNGPNRSTKVKIFCGTENKLTSVSEPNRCEYSFDFETPAACFEATHQEGEDVHDEL